MTIVHGLLSVSGQRHDTFVSSSSTPAQFNNVPRALSTSRREPTIPVCLSSATLLPLLSINCYRSSLPPPGLEFNTDQRFTMSTHQRPHEANSEAAEPLYRDSSDEAEKRSQHDLDAQTQVLLASIRRLRRWLIAVSVLLGLLSVYTLFSFRHVVTRDQSPARRHEFAPESMLLRSTATIR